METIMQDEQTLYLGAVSYEISQTTTTCNPDWGRGPDHSWHWAYSVFRLPTHTNRIAELLFKLPIKQVFFKENVRYPVWTCRDPISLILGTQFSVSRYPMIIFSDSRDPIFNSWDPPGP